MHFAWQGSYSIQSDFELCGNDTLAIHITVAELQDISALPPKPLAHIITPTPSYIHSTTNNFTSFKMAKGNSYFSNNGVAVQRVNLPAMIRCIRCKKPKYSAAFSDNQQKELKAMILQQPNFNATMTGYVSCSECAPSGQKFEFRCHGYCQKILARAKFSKANLRNNPDRPWCEACQTKKSRMEPGGVDSDVEAGSDDDDSDRTSGGGSDNEGASVAGTFSGISLGGTSSFQTSNTGGVVLPTSGFTSHQSTASQQASTSGAGPSTGRFSPPHLRSKGPSSVYAASEASFVTGAAGRSRHAPSTTMGDRDPASGGGKFAKLRAVRPQGPEGTAPVVQTPKKTQTKVQKKTHADDDGDSICVSASDSD
ncbi:hypothetical protein LTS10_004259 [Elasticomyces elasticus]|nr:hypothetical protein LTS10_004259 [Elasticomyces elasticus]